MIGVDRGDALEQVAAFVLAVLALYWCCWMDHADDGLPDEGPPPKWWKRSQEKAFNLGHAARIDPGVALARRLSKEAVGEPVVG